MRFVAIFRVKHQVEIVDANVAREAVGASDSGEDLFALAHPKTIDVYDPRSYNIVLFGEGVDSRRFSSYISQGNHERGILEVYIQVFGSGLLNRNLGEELIGLPKVQLVD